MHASKGILNLPTSSLHLCSPFQQNHLVKIHRQFTSSKTIWSRFITAQKDSPRLFIYLKIRRRNGVESLTTLEEGEFKLAIDGCISAKANGSYIYALFHFLLIQLMI